jgi:hypothetical protein
VAREAGNRVIVATDTAKDGNPVSVRDVQGALDTLDRTGEVVFRRATPGTEEPHSSEPSSERCPTWRCRPARASFGAAADDGE